MKKWQMNIKDLSTVSQVSSQLSTGNPSIAKKLTAGKGSLVSKLLIGLMASSVLLSGCTSIPFVTNKQTYGYGVPQTQRTVAQRILDQGIENTAKVNVYAYDPNLKTLARIDVDSFDSKVLLTGEVPNEISKKNVESIIASMPDVLGIYNELKVGRRHTMSYNVLDGYITTQFMGKVLASPSLKTSQIDVVTELGVVYVMGRVTESQLQQLINIANQTPVVMELVLLTTVFPDVNTTNVNTNNYYGYHSQTQPASLSAQPINQQLRYSNPRNQYTSTPTPTLKPFNLKQR